MILDDYWQWRRVFSCSSTALFFSLIVVDTMLTMEINNVSNGSQLIGWNCHVHSMKMKRGKLFKNLFKWLISHLPWEWTRRSPPFRLRRSFFTFHFSPSSSRLIREKFVASFNSTTLIHYAKISYALRLLLLRSLELWLSPRLADDGTRAILMIVSPVRQRRKFCVKEISKYLHVKMSYNSSKCLMWREFESQNLKRNLKSCFSDFLEFIQDIL